MAARVSSCVDTVPRFVVPGRFFAISVGYIVGRISYNDSYAIMTNMLVVFSLLWPGALEVPESFCLGYG